MSAAPGHTPRFVITWVPIVTALLSIALSIYTFFVARGAPVVELLLPQQIRLAQGAEIGYAYAYFQPTFLHAGPSDRVEVVRAMRLEFAPAGATDDATDDAVADADATPATLDWRESGRMVWEPATQTIGYAYSADAAPLLLSRETAQSPLGVFYGPPGWYLTPGTWRATFTAERAAGPPLVARFSFTLDAATIDQLNLSGGNIFIPVAIRAE